MVLHEIYGINKHIKDYCQFLRKQGFKVLCPNLLGKEKHYDYSQEEIAYRNFMENINVEIEANKLKDQLKVIRSDYKKIFIIGFSMGATIAWLCAEADFIDGVVAYYGSRIRDSVDVTPNCPVVLFFPQKERSFNVDRLITFLNKKNVESYKFNGEHGFSDPYSAKYNSLADEEARKISLKFLEKV
ncbi:dienelactone hydrolase family protein [Domibacillus epiphyticus]|uniref:dienelactone hydrolase family protein n=1 Tax=Domibacillus epiphyticus TaxID=1714355 RepID=UPI001E595A01|nr:dienelactone hydrolase family protein [Domibacillus epiphyticus]